MGAVYTSSAQDPLILWDRDGSRLWDLGRGTWDGTWDVGPRPTVFDLGRRPTDFDLGRGTPSHEIRLGTWDGVPQISTWDVGRRPNRSPKLIYF